MGPFVADPELSFTRDEAAYILGRSTRTVDRARREICHQGSAVPRYLDLAELAAISRFKRIVVPLNRLDEFGVPPEAYDWFYGNRRSSMIVPERAQIVSDLKEAAALDSSFGSALRSVRLAGRESELSEVVATLLLLFGGFDSKRRKGGGFSNSDVMRRGNGQP